MLKSDSYQNLPFFVAMLNGGANHMNANLRKGIDSLVEIVTLGFKLNPFEEGNIFLFCGRRTDRIKALLYEGDGWLLLYKRLTDGKFQWPRNDKDVKELTPQQYRWLMDGLSVSQKKVIKPVKIGKI